MDNHDEEFIKALDQTWKYIKGNGMFTGRELTEWTNGMDSVLVRKLLKALIQTLWNDYGIKD